MIANGYLRLDLRSGSGPSRSVVRRSAGWGVMSTPGQVAVTASSMWHPPP
jgi:hypothetical protein